MQEPSAVVHVRIGRHFFGALHMRTDLHLLYTIYSFDSVPFGAVP